VSLETTLARIAQIQGALQPAAPPQAQPVQPPSGQSFDAQLRGAMAPSASAATATAGRAPAAPGQYPHLQGDLDASPEILRRLEALAAKRGQTFNVTSGHRSIEEQQRLWDNRHNNPFPVAPPGKSRHESGRACDVTVGGQPIQNVISDAELRAFGLVPLKGDAVHVELA
jgi:D-alanyl-D-alanine carboxypeptidase-like protein